MLEWILLFFLFIICALCFFPSRWIKGFGLIWITFPLVLLTGLRGEGFDRDYESYLYMFNDPYFSVEPSFKFIANIVHYVFNSNEIFLFLIYACFGIIFKFIAIDKISVWPPLSLVIYFSNYFLLHELTQIRVGVATGLLLLAIPHAYHRERLKFLLFVLAATFFHYSSLVFLLVYPLGALKSVKLIYYIVPTGYILYFLGVDLIFNLPIPGIQDKLDLIKFYHETSSSEATQPINVWNLYQLVKIAILYLLIAANNRLKYSSPYFILLLYIYALSLSLVPLLSSVQVIGFRTSELFGVVEILLYPFLALLFPYRKLGVLIVVLMSVVLFYGNLYVNKLFYLE
jgi:hypothetical protein